MKTLTAITAAALVMAATGCETTKPKPKPITAAPAPTMKFPANAPTTITAYDPTVFNEAMAAQYSRPQPVIVTGGGGSGVTMASQVGGTTIVSQFGGYRPPIYNPPVPIYTGNTTPTVYTMPIQQP